MSDELKRWSADAPEDYHLAKSAYATLRPSAEQLERILARVEFGTQPAVADTSSSPAEPCASTPARLPAKFWLWLSGLGVLGLALLLALALPRDRRSTLPTTTESALAPSRVAPTPSIPVTTPHVASEVGLVRATPPAAVRSARPRTLSDPLAELVLLDRARRVMATNPARALTLTDEHQRTYPSGQFAEERKLLAIEALVGLGRTEAAERRARSFLRAYPNSVHGHRLDVILRRDAR